MHLIERLQSRSTEVYEQHTILLGPPAKLQLSASDRRRAQIPPEAETYSFAYPARDANGAAASKLISELVGSVHRQLEPHLMFLLMGGFVYFGAGDNAGDGTVPDATDDGQRIIRVNGLSFAPGRSGMLYFDGPYEAPTPTLPAMEAFERMQPVSLHQLLGEGVTEIGWLNSAEGGAVLVGAASEGAAGAANGEGGVEGGAPVAPWTSGAMLCKLGDGRSVYFKVKASAPSTSKQPSGYVRAVAMLEGLYSAADASSRRLESDLASFYRSDTEKWLRFFGVLIPAYFLLGVYLYSAIEGWSPLDTAYFLVVTVTTVGYGDYAPVSPSGRLLTSLYAPLGTIVVMTGLQQPVYFLLSRAMRHLALLANRIERLVLSAAHGELGALLCALLSCLLRAQPA